MEKQLIIERTIKAINRLPAEKAEEIGDFADFVMQRFEETHILEGIQMLVAESRAFDFLAEEDDIYTERDIKGPYNG